MNSTVEMNTSDEKLREYISDHISKEPELLARTYLHTQIYSTYPRMCTDHIQGRLLKMLTAMIAPKKVLELGTFTGYSALCIAEAMAEDGELHTVEIDDEKADELESRFAESEHGSKISLHIGDALTVAKELDMEWDMVFIDANKRHYCDYYRIVMPRLRKGGYILADNTLWDGHVVDSAYDRDPQTVAIREFNDMVADDPAVEVSIIPIRDGLTIIRKV